MTPITITDIVNSFPQEDFDKLSQQYNDILEVFFPNTSLKEQVIIIDICFKYLKSDKFKDLNSTIKSWCVFIVRKLYDEKFLTNESQIINQIDDFIKHHNINYNQYIDDIEQFCSEYDRDIVFIKNYINLTKTPLLNN